MTLMLVQREACGKNGGLQKKTNLAGYPLLICDRSQLLSLLCERMDAGEKSLMFFANSNFVVKCVNIRQRFYADDVVVLNDGIAVEAANRIINGGHFTENMNGTDLIPYMLRTFPRPLRLFLYGSRPEVVAKAASVYGAMGHAVVGYCDGFTGSSEEVCLAIERSGAELVLVALGNPLQESWILQNARNLSPQVFIGVGALFDFSAGAVVRAPLWMRRVRLEWLYRLLREPRRLVRRYSIDMLRFFAICWRDRHVGRNASAKG